MTASTITDMTATDGFIRIEWDDATKLADWRSWRVYGIGPNASDWTLLYETFEDQATYQYDLWQFVANAPADYCVTQTSQSGTDPIAETPKTDTTMITPEPQIHFWLIDPLDSSNNIELLGVTDFPQTVDRERSAYYLIGRGNKADVGGRMGYSGTMSGQFFERSGISAREQRYALQQYAERNAAAYLRTTFALTFQVQIDSISVTPIAGTGLSEVADWTFNYIEVGGVPLGFAG